MNSRPKRFKFVAAVFLVLYKNNKILLQRRKNTGWEDGNYNLISGHVEGNESLTQAMEREAKEEAEIMVDPKKLKLIYVMHRAKTDYERLDFYFTINSWTGEPKIAEASKADHLDWFPLDNLPKNITHPVLIAIQDIQKNKNFGEYGW